MSLASQDNAAAQAYVGFCYGAGKGTAKDAAAAVEWNRTTHREFSAWAYSQECDLSRTLTFDGMQEAALREETCSRGGGRNQPRLRVRLLA